VFGRVIVSIVYQNPDVDAAVAPGRYGFAMAGCCDPSGYPGAFNRTTAENSVKSFEKKGLDSTATPMVEALRNRLTGSTVLEVGAGSATAIATMLEAGADRAVAVDLSPNYETTARRFLAARGLEESVEWHTGDFVAMGDDLPRADVVFSNRVVCCYPDMAAMIDTTTRGSQRLVAVSYPRRNLPSRFVTWAINQWMRVNRNSFRTFVHDPDAIAARLTRAGFEPIETGSTAIWHWGVWERTA
jgi:magnesium-protoporphyrin O-methyltransferase